MSKPNRFLFWLAPVAAFAVGAGIAVSSRSNQDAGTPLADSIPSSLAPVGTPTPALPARSTAPTPAQEQTKARTKAWSQDKFVEAIGFPSALHRRWAVKRFFDSLTIDQFPAALAAIEKSTEPLDLDLKTMLFRSWAQDAPDAALRSARTLADPAERSATFGAAVRAWGRRDIISALAWAEKNLTGQERATNLSYLTTLAEKGNPSPAPSLSPQEEFQRAVQEPTQEKMDSMQMSALSKWAATDPAAAANEALKSTSISVRNYGLFVALNAWVKRDRAAAAAFLNRLDDPSEKASLRTTAVQQLIGTEPKAALEFALLQPAGPQRVAEAGRALSAIYSKEPEAAVGLYNVLSDEDKKGSFGAFIKAWKEQDIPQAAEALLATGPLPPDGNLRAHEARALRFAQDLQPWIQRESRAVGDLALRLPERERAEVLYAVAQEWCRTDAPAAGAWAAGLPAGPARNEALKQFTYSWAQHDSSRVTAWLNALPADSSKDAAATGFAFSIFDTDPDAALSWTRVIRDEPERMKTLGNAWRQWRSKNSSAATSWLDSATELSEAERAALQDAASK